MQFVILDTAILEEEALRLRHEMAGISQSVRARIDLNARSCIGQGKYEREYQGTTERLAELEDRLKCIEVKNSPPSFVSKPGRDGGYCHTGRI